MSHAAPRKSPPHSDLIARRAELAAELKLFRRKAAELRQAAESMRAAKAGGGLLDELEATAVEVERACAHIVAVLASIDEELRRS